MRVSRVCQIVAGGVLLAGWQIGCGDHPTTAPQIVASASGNGGGVTVTATDPNNASQGVTLDVHVVGSGYDRGSNAQWARSGVVSPNVTTNSIQFVSSTELLANITIASIADTGRYDVLVTTSKGKKGIGSELFTVKKQPGPPPQSNPQISFWNGGNLRVMNADGSNVTTLFSIPAATRPASWAPFGDGSAANPYHLVFDRINDSICTLVMMDVDTIGGIVHGTNPRVLPTPGYACAPAWSPIGDEISYGGSQEGSSPFVIGPSPLFVIPSTGGTPTALYTPPLGSYVFYSAWRSDGSAIAFTEVLNNAYALRVINRATGAVTTVVAAGTFVEIAYVSWARTRDVLAFCIGRPVNKNFVRLEVDTIRLARDVNGNYVAGGTPGYVTGGCASSWSPNDARLAVSGINVFDLLTGTTQSLASGSGPDWRRF
jgi:hypothetical protein